jgi:hypothetical protein
MMMVQTKLFIVLLILTLNKSRTVAAKVTFNRMKLSEKNYQNDEVKRCDEISPVVLNDILGAAFNSRCVCFILRQKIMTKRIYLIKSV